MGNRDLTTTFAASTSDFEIPTMNQFLNAVFSGDMPGGVKTTLPLFPREEMAHFSKKYADWAPEPFSKLPAPATILGTMPGDSPAAIIRVMNIMSGMDDMFNMAFSLTTVERSFKSMKSKVRTICHALETIPLSSIGLVRNGACIRG